MFSKALLAIDRSPSSEAAITRVPDVTASEAVVLEVLVSVAETLGRFTESERKVVEQRLDDAAARLRAAGIEKVSTMIAEGRPGPEIVKVAEQEQCDVIVMSTHGRKGLKRALLGSVAEYVVQHGDDHAILLVRPPDGNGAAHEA